MSDKKSKAVGGSAQRFEKGDKAGNFPFKTPGGIVTNVEGLAVEAGFGNPAMSEFRTDIDNAVGEGAMPLERPDGSESSGGVLSKFLKSAKK